MWYVNSNFVAAVNVTIRWRNIVLISRATGQRKLKMLERYFIILCLAALAQKYVQIARKF